MNFYIIYWHKTDRPGANGYDLVQAKDKKEARAKFELYYQSPIKDVIGPGDESYEEITDNIREHQFTFAEKGAIVSISGPITSLGKHSETRL